MKPQSYLEQGYKSLLVISNYFRQVYIGYGYLYKASTEIAWEQVGLDSAQDGVLDASFEEAIKLGHSASEIKISKCCSGGFFHHLKSHLVQKTAAVIVFPWVAPILNSTHLNNIPGKTLIAEGAEFSGINPLEGLYSISAIPKMILGDNNTISNAAEFFTFHDIFNIEKAKDLNFNEYMKFFKSFMEVCDGWGHSVREFTTLYNNRHLTSMPLKTYAYLRIKLGLYHNTKNEEALNDKRIEQLSLQAQEAKLNENQDQEGICLNHENPSWIAYLYENKWTITYNILTEILFAKIFTELYTRITSIDWKSYLSGDDKKFNHDPNQKSDIPYTKGYPLDNPFWPDNYANDFLNLWSINNGKQVELLGIFKRKTDDEILKSVDGSAIEYYNNVQGQWINEDNTLEGQEIIYKLIVSESKDSLNEEVAQATHTLARTITPPPVATAQSCPDLSKFSGLKTNIIATPSPSRLKTSSAYSEGRKPKPIFEPIKEERLDLNEEKKSPIIKPTAVRRPSETSKYVLGDGDDRVKDLMPPPLYLPPSATGQHQISRSILKNGDIDDEYQGPFCQSCAHQHHKKHKTSKQEEGDTHQNAPTGINSYKTWIVDTLLGKCTDPNCQEDH